MKRKSKIISLILAVIMISCALMSACGSDGSSSEKSGPEEALKAFMNAMIDKNAKKMMDYMPKGMIDYWCGEHEITRAEFIEELQDEIAEEIDDMTGEFEEDYGKGSLKVETGKKKSVRSGELEEIKEEFADGFNIKVQDAAYVTYSLVYKTRGGDTKPLIDNYDFLMIKVGGKWYIGDKSFYY